MVHSIMTSKQSTMPSFILNMVQPQSTFLRPEDVHPKLYLLEQLFPVIQKEWQQAKDKIEFRDFTSYQAQTIGNEGQGYEINHMSYFTAPIVNKDTKWGLAPLYFQGDVFNPNAVHMPKTCRILREIEALTYSGFTVLYPSASLGWHYDPEPGPDVINVRVQLPVESTGESILELKNESRVQVEGKLCCFTSGSLHRVVNHGNAERFSLILDYLRRRSQ